MGEHGWPRRQISETGVLTLTYRAPGAGRAPTSVTRAQNFASATTGSNPAQTRQIPPPRLTAFGYAAVA